MSAADRHHQPGIITDTKQGRIFAVRYNRTGPSYDRIKDENEESAKRIVRYCDALFETFVKGVQCAVHENKYLFERGASAKLLLADNGMDNICQVLCTSITNEDDGSAESPCVLSSGLKDGICDDA